MAPQSTSTLAPVTEDAFTADRQGMWNAVCHGGLGILIFTVIVLILMATFLT